jgi:hypothetical protein
VLCSTGFSKCGISRPLGSAQIDVKMSFKGRQPNKESAAKPLCRYVSPATALHTKGNVILDAWRSLKRLNFALPMRKKESKSAFLRSRKQALAAD